MSNPFAAFRHRNLLTQEQAAKATAVSLSTWCQLERGYRGRRPSPSLLTLLDALDRLRGGTTSRGPRGRGRRWSR